MTAERETTRIVRSWLREDEHESADHILEMVLARLGATPQRRSWWPARRYAPLNTRLKVLIAAAAVVVVALAGYQLLPRNGSIGGPGATPTTVPTPTIQVTPAPSATARVVPSSGPLSAGRYPVMLEGVPFTMAFPQSGWQSNGTFGFDKPPFAAPASAGIIVWEDDADGIFSDPCNQTRAPRAGPTAGDMAAAIATVPGTVLVTGPTAVTIGGKPAQKVVIRIPDELPCPANEYYLWYDETIKGNARFAAYPGTTIRVWIIEADGKRLQLDAESYVGAGPEIDAELNAIIGSIQFD